MRQRFVIAIVVLLGACAPPGGGSCTRERNYCFEQIPLPDGGFSSEGTEVVQRCGAGVWSPDPCPRPSRVSDSAGCCVLMFVGDETMPGYYRYRACSLTGSSEWNRAVCETRGGTWGM